MGNDDNVERSMSEEAVRHYVETVGQVSDPMVSLFQFDPDYFESYTGIRKRLYDEDAALPPSMRELLFVMLAVIRNNPHGARTHLRAGARAGLQLSQVHQMLMFLLFELGADSWFVSGGSKIWSIACEELGTS